jgi:hypothetical protein
MKWREDRWLLLWVFRSIDAAIWGSKMWANNEHAIDVSEAVIGEGKHIVVTKLMSSHHVLKFLSFNEDLGEWRVMFDLVFDVIELRGGDSDGSMTDAQDSPALDEI